MSLYFNTETNQLNFFVSDGEGILEAASFAISINSKKRGFNNFPEALMDVDYSKHELRVIHLLLGMDEKERKRIGLYHKNLRDNIGRMTGGK